MPGITRSATVYRGFNVMGESKQVRKNKYAENWRYENNSSKYVECPRCNRKVTTYFRKNEDVARYRGHKNDHVNKISCILSSEPVEA